LCNSGATRDAKRKDAEMGGHVGEREREKINEGDKTKKERRERNDGDRREGRYDGGEREGVREGVREG